MPNEHVLNGKTDRANVLAPTVFDLYMIYVKDVVCVEYMLSFTTNKSENSLNMLRSDCLEAKINTKQFKMSNQCVLV